MTGQETNEYITNVLQPIIRENPDTITTYLSKFGANISASSAPSARIECDCPNCKRGTLTMIMDANKLWQFRCSLCSIYKERGYWKNLLGLIYVHDRTKPIYKILNELDDHLRRKAPVEESGIVLKAGYYKGMDISFIPLLELKHVLETATYLNDRQKEEITSHLREQTI